MAGSLKRTAGYATFAAPLVLVAALGACGDDDDGTAGLSSIVIQPTSFVTQPSTTTAQAGSGAVTSDETRATGTQVYTVDSGDFLSGIAADYDVALDELVAINDWPEGVEHRIDPGDSVIIPPGALTEEARLAAGEEEDEESDEDEDAEDEDAEAEDEDEETETTEDDGTPLDERRCPDGELQGTYTIEQGDIPARVANSLGVTLDELEEANANTPGYRNFIVGVEILVPCEDD